MSSDFDEMAFQAELAKRPPSVLGRWVQLLVASPALATTLRLEIQRSYAGDDLDAQLKQYGQYRLPGESDWGFRKRTFPAVFAQDEEEAIRLIFTCPHTLLTEPHLGLLGSLSQDTSPAGLRRWADGFATDPFHTYHPPI